MITKPEDAVPHVFRYAGTRGGEGNVYVRKENGDEMRIDMPIFTAAECAQIAKLIRHATVVQIKASHRMQQMGQMNDTRNFLRYSKLFLSAAKYLNGFAAKLQEWEKT